MTEQDAYIARVLRRLPPGSELHRQVELELRGHIAERMEHGHSLADALRQLGDPEALADSYLAAVPLVTPRLWPRFAAKLVDFVLVIAAFAPLVWLAMTVDRASLVVLCILFMVAVMPGYPIFAEYRFGRTIGKYLFSLYVVRESGGRIGLGQSFVRQLPAFFQVFWVDAFFVLFTEKRQRAFELLSKTRVVLKSEAPS
jgi:uncharacterized RDD family membrane protein YckC